MPWQNFRISFTDVVRTIVGVVGDIRDRGLDVLDPNTMIYLPIQQDLSGAVTLVARAPTPAAPRHRSPTRSPR
jgi:hypothetical protein